MARVETRKDPQGRGRAVNKQARLRGVFESTGEGVEPQQVKAKILDAVRRLEREN